MRHLIVREDVFVLLLKAQPGIGQIDEHGVEQPVNDVIPMFAMPDTHDQE